MVKSNINVYFENGVQFIFGNYKSGTTGLKRCVTEAKKIQSETGGVRIYIYKEGTHKNNLRYLWVYFITLVPLNSRFENIGYVANGLFFEC